MLVLTRRTDEEIVIDGNIRIKVLTSKGDRVRLGITAPASVRVDRGEIHARRSEFAAVVVDRVAKSLGGRPMQRKLVAVASSISAAFESAATADQPVA